MKDPDAQKVGRAFSSKVVEMALASYPGFFMTSPPSGESQIGVYWPTLVPSAAVEQRVVIGEDVDRHPARRPPATFAPPAAPGSRAARGAGRVRPRDLPLGTICGARSGDKGGNANVGVWVRTPGGVSLARRAT